MTTSASRLIKNPWFVVPLVVKVVCLPLFASTYLRELFLPFVTYFVDSGFANPWDEFLRLGRTQSFPYSGAMLAMTALPVAIAKLILPASLYSLEPIRIAAIKLPLLVADYAILRVLINWLPARVPQALKIYWCSPILFYISYVHGQLDSIPSALLFLSLFYLFRKRPLASGMILGLGIAAKFHIAMALPFMAIALLKSSGPRDRTFNLLALVLGAAFTATDLIVPLISSEGYRVMVLGAPESSRVFDLALSLSPSIKIYLGPTAALLVLLRFYYAPKANRDLTLVFLALAYSILVLLVPPMPGWYFWSIPLACYYYVREDRPRDPSLWLINLAYIVYYGFFWRHSNAMLESLAFTALQGAYAMGVYWMYRFGIQSNAQYSARGVSTLLGIGGDSGTGKSTLAAMFTEFLGTTDVAQADGDDYHRWARGDTAWKTKTHLDPMANKMFQPIEHLRDLKAGRAVMRPVYDHGSGKFLEPARLDPKRFILFVGLHPFYIRKMRALLDVKIYLDPDENLRREWKLARDQRERGYTAEQSLEQLMARSDDSRAFIHPQREFADWVIAYSREGDATRVRHTLRNDLVTEGLIDLLRAQAGLQVDWDLHPDMERQVLEVRGALDASAVSEIAHALYPNLDELIGHESPGWRSDLDGINQLLLLCLLDDAAKN